MQIREFDLREADWSRDGALLSEIRRIVFIVEQSVPKHEEWDGRDEESWHWLATDKRGNPIGTARLLPEGQIGRMAVLIGHRGTGVGAALLEAAVEKARHLGFDSVFLNAQSHALEFYKRCGFLPEGDEFMEAGIPHFRMTRKLAPRQDSPRLEPGALADVSLRRFDAAEVDFERSGKIIKTIRETVFQHELGLDQTFVGDEEDASAIHWQAQLPDGQVIGAARMSLTGTISRVAVLPGHRGQGVGHALIELAEAKARRFGLPSIDLLGRADLAKFYRSAGFEPDGEIFMAQGIEHQAWARALQYLDVYDRTRSPLSGDAWRESDVAYVLGRDKQLLLLRREEEFRNAILEMCKQASQAIRIYSPVLEHKLFDHAELRDICSALARKNRYTRVEILIYDSHRVVKNGHALMDISRKLPSSINIKIVDPELRQLNHEYVLVDDCGVIYRHDFEGYEGYANFYDVTETNRLKRAFTAAWESGVTDPNLRQLRI